MRLGGLRWVAPWPWIVWLSLTSVGAYASYQASRIEPQAAPAPELLQWAFQELKSMGTSEKAVVTSPPSSSYRGHGPTHVIAWKGGVPLARYVGNADLASAVREAVQAWGDDPRLSEASSSVHFSIAVTDGYAPVVQGVPFLSSLGVVPLLEGVEVRWQEQTAALTSDELVALGAFDAAVTTPIPDLSFGMDWRRVYAALGSQLGVDAYALAGGGRVRRFRTQTFVSAGKRAGPEPLPAGDEVSVERLERAAREGARFLMRHQAPDGRFAYRYDARTARVDNHGYNVVRHAGTAYFLGQAARVLRWSAARRASLRAVEWLMRHQLRTCGATDRLCVDTGPGPNVGATALAVLALSELIEASADGDPDQGRLRTWLVGLVRFLQFMQRPDGELMHEYDLAHDRPVDVQRLYFSGEAALALLRAHRVLQEPGVLETARRLMDHVMGRHWQFFGSRYYFGEEHWTCMAVGEAADRLDVQEGIDFCLRWERFNARLQYAGESPWAIRGAYGVGPLLLPRTTPAATRAEAFISLHSLLRDARRRDAVGQQIDRALGFLMRYQSLPGRVHLMADPARAQGGIPQSPASFEVRNDFVQHACSAMLRWAQAKRGDASN